MVISRKRLGFTLVELLVVISIIGILVGLLVPVIGVIRDRARLTQCINNQKNIGTAIIAFDGSKGHLPGVVSRVIPTDTNSPLGNWVTSLFTDFDRADLAQAWREGNLQPVKIDLLLCPSNRSMEPTGGLSYLVNMGVYKMDNSSPPKADYSFRLFRNRATNAVSFASPEPDFSLVSVKSSTKTVMLSESLAAGPWTFVPSTPGKPGGTFAPPYYDITLSSNPTNIPDPALIKLAFAWPFDPYSDPTLARPNPIPPSAVLFNNQYLPGISSLHGGGKVVITFCDGHTETLQQDAACWYDPNTPVIGTP